MTPARFGTPHILALMRQAARNPPVVSPPLIYLLPHEVRRFVGPEGAFRAADEGKTWARRPLKVGP